MIGFEKRQNFGSFPGFSDHVEIFLCRQQLPEAGPE
jgi:hypothetical protein